MPSSQTLSLADRRLVAAWAADCASRVLALFEAEAPQDPRPRDAIDRARAFARGELDAAQEIRDRFVAGRAAYAAKAASLAPQTSPASADHETAWQLGRLDEQTRAALARLPSLGEDRAGPLGAGLLTRGELGATIRRIQERL